MSLSSAHLFPFFRPLYIGCIIFYTYLSLNSFTLPIAYPPIEAISVQGSPISSVSRRNCFPPSHSPHFSPNLFLKRLSSPRTPLLHSSSSHIWHCLPNSIRVLQIMLLNLKRFHPRSCHPPPCPKYLVLASRVSWHYLDTLTFNIHPAGNLIFLWGIYQYYQFQAYNWCFSPSIVYGHNALFQ